MHAANAFLQQSADWRPAAQLRRRSLPPALRSWLLDESSLTQRLIAVCGDQFHVQVLSQQWERPYTDEQRLLKVRTPGSAWVRQVRLMSGDKPLVFARSIIPRATLTGPNRRLARLGSRPLGAALFADPTMTRGAVQVARLAASDALFARAVEGLTTRPEEIWGRRSVFHLRGQALLVSEIFLPGIPAAPK